MGDVKRYDMVGGCYAQPFHTMDETGDGEYVLQSDYARLEREHAAAQAELTRLLAVEAAANAFLDAYEGESSVTIVYASLALAEACGRKG